MNTTKLIIRVLLCACFCHVSTLEAQSKKKIKKFNIHTCMVTEQKGSATITVSKSVYTQNGLLSEEYTYNNQGLLESLKKFSYNAKGNPLMERKFDSQNRLVETKTFKYNAANQKTEELTFDEKFKMKKREVFSYDTKGLKKEKKTFNDKNSLVSVKKYIYTMDEALDK